MNNDKDLIFCHYAQVSLDWVLIETRTHTHSHRYSINQNLKVELTLHGNFQGTVLSSRFLFPNCSSSAEREGSWVGCNSVFKGFWPNLPPAGAEMGTTGEGRHLPGCHSLALHQPPAADLLPLQILPCLGNLLALKPFHPQVS